MRVQSVCRSSCQAISFNMRAAMNQTARLSWQAQRIPFSALPIICGDTAGKPAVRLSGTLEWTPAASALRKPQPMAVLSRITRWDKYWLGLCNFYILTRYNKSFFYAAAVYQLSQRLKQRFKPAMTQNLFKSSQNS